MSFKFFITTSCAIAALATSGSASAQTADATTGIGDIVVTAAKRATNVQDTPIAITAVSQDTLIRQGVKDINDLTRVAPEVSFQATGTNTVIRIRGLSGGNFGPTTDSATATHLDGNYLARYTGLNGFTYDLERVEVLAGPQGTLFGRNSVGGAINFVTAKPQLGQTGGRISADIGNYNSLVLQAAANLAVGDDLAIRVAGMRNRRDGFFTDTNGGAVDSEGYRVGVKWQPTEKDTFVLQGDWQHVGGEPAGGNAITQVYRSPTLFSVTTPAAGATAAGVGSVGTSCPAGATCSSAVVPINASDDPVHHNRVVNGGDFAALDTSNDGYNFQWDHNLDFATLTAQGSWRTTDSFDRTGTLQGALQDARLKAAGVVNGSPGIGSFRTNSEWNSQEIRLTSNDAAQTMFKYVVGVNHFHEKAHALGATRPEASWWANNTPTTAPGASIGGLVYPVGPTGEGIFTGGGAAEQNIRTNAFAAFTDVTYTPPAWEALHINLGARYSSETRRGIGEVYVRSNPGQAYSYAPYNGQVVCPAGTLAAICGPVVVNYTGYYDEEKTWDRFTYKANVSYDLTDSNMVYATYSTGFVSGGYNYGPPPSGDITSKDHSYAPQFIEAMEIGAKNRFFDNSLQVNAALYHYDFTNYLVNQSLQVPDPLVANSKRTGIFSTVNGGASKFEGGTFDVEWLPFADDRIHFNGSYTEATIKFELSQFFFNSTKAILQSLNLSSTDACVTAAMVGPAPCADYTTYINSSGLPTNGSGALYAGSVYPTDWDREGPVGRTKWTLNADYSHTFHIPDATLDAQIAWHYQTKAALGISAPSNPYPVVPDGFISTAEYGRAPSRATWDLSFRYQREDSRWNITAYARNVLDDETRTARGLTSNVQGATSYNPTTQLYAGPTGAVLGAPAYLFQTEGYGAPRTFGVQFQSSF